MNVKRVTSLVSEELSVYLGLNEKQLKRFYEPKIGLFICESEKVIRRALKAGYVAESYFVEEEKLDAVKSFCNDDDTEELNRLSDVGENRVVILGNEDHGISKEILDICDKNIIIPMKQEVDSLNVAAASAVAFWEIFK